MQMDVFEMDDDVLDFVLEMVKHAMQRWMWDRMSVWVRKKVHTPPPAITYANREAPHDNADNNPTPGGPVGGVRTGGDCVSVRGECPRAGG